MATTTRSGNVKGHHYRLAVAETAVLYRSDAPDAAEIDDHLVNHPLAVCLRNTPGIIESRLLFSAQSDTLPHSFVRNTLIADHKISVPPLMFYDPADGLPATVHLAHIGAALCGHAGIIHGGLLATLFDEEMARACFPTLPNKVGLTKKLEIDYRKPCPANSYIACRAKTTKVEGRKAWVEAEIELISGDATEGTTLATAKALFVEPRNTKHMVKAIDV